MVENLNRLTFSRFGKILRDSLPNRGFPEGDAWTETVRRFTAADARFFKLADGELYLDFESGMTVLALRREEEVICFYLDKPVRLPVGTVFAIVPYQEECTVRMALPVQCSQLTRQR